MLRSDPHAQYEIQEHAKIIASIYKEHFPHTYEAFVGNVLNGKHFSAKEVATLRHLLQESGNTKDTVEAAGLDQGIKQSRMKSFLNKLGL